MTKRLVVLAGPDEGRVFPLTGETLLIGRSRATEAALIDPHVSRVHCQIQMENGQVVLTDYESAAGTFVNGKRTTKQVLKTGDLIRLGTTHLQLTEDAPTETAAPKRATHWAETLVGNVFGEFKVGSILARGKSGYVFHGRDTKRNQAVAIKVLDPSFSEDKTAVARFAEAMKKVMPLRHPHLLRVFGAGKTDGYCWIAKEYVQGESLAAVIGRIEAPGQLDWRHALRMAIFLAQALEFAHSKNLLHQNVTPHNILLGRTPQETKLADLMLSDALIEDPTQPISAAGLPSESLGYQSPERTIAEGPVDARTDIYSLGATLFALIMGQPPFQGETVKELIKKIRTQPVASLRSLKVPIPEALDLLILKMLAKKPEERYGSMHEVRVQLELVARAEGVAL